MKKYNYLFLGAFLTVTQLFFLPPAWSASGGQDGPARLLDLAESYLSGNDYSRAENLYNEVLRIERKNHRAYFQLGVIALRHYRNNNKAIHYFSKAIEFNDGEIEYYIKRGAAYAAIKDWEQAINDYSKALAIEPENSWALSSRARSYEGSRETDKAIADYKTAQKYDPHNVATYEIEIARVSLSQGAEIEKSSENSGIFLQRAIQLLNRGENLELAEEDLKTTIELDSNNDWAHFLLGKIYAVSRNEPELAVKHFSKAIKLNKIVPDYYFFRGKVHGKNGRYKEAKQDFDIAIQLDPRNGEPYFYRGVCQLELQMTNEAQDDFIKFKQLDPQRGTRADSYLENLLLQKETAK